MEVHDFSYGEDGTYQEAVKNDQSHTVFFYDLAGNQVREEDYDQEGHLLRYSENKYDWKGRMTKQTWYDENGIAYGHTENEYGEDGSTTKVTQYNADGDITGYIVYEIGPEGNLTVTFFTKDDSIISEQVFDEEGGLLQRTDYGLS